MSQSFQRALGRQPGSVGHGTVVPQRLEALDEGALPHFWYPGRPAVELPPQDFAAKLTAVHPDLQLTKPPARAPISPRAWLLWTKQPRVTHRLCPGWQLLMIWALGDQPLPLDERIFAAIYHFDARHAGSAVQYFDRMIEERERTRAKAKRAYDNDLHDHARDFYATTKIKNIGRGNKFALHHDGTLIPSRGEANWSRERERAMMPASVLRERDATLPTSRR